MVVISAPGLSADSGSLHERVGCAVDVHGAGAAQRHAAAVLGAGEVQVVAQDPEQRRVGAARSTMSTRSLLTNRVGMMAPERSAWRRTAARACNR